MIGIPAAIPIITSLILGLPITLALVTSGFIILLVVSGFMFRSYGRERKPDFQNP
jgi:hypothetical protein